MGSARLAAMFHRQIFAAVGPVRGHSSPPRSEIGQVESWRGDRRDRFPVARWPCGFLSSSLHGTHNGGEVEVTGSHRSKVRVHSLTFPCGDRSRRLNRLRWFDCDAVGVRSETLRCLFCCRTVTGFTVA